MLLHVKLEAYFANGHVNVQNFSDILVKNLFCFHSSKIDPYLDNTNSFFKSIFYSFPSFILSQTSVEKSQLTYKKSQVKSVSYSKN